MCIRDSDQVDPAMAQPRQRRAADGDMLRSEALGAQGIEHGVGDRGLVFDDEDSGCLLYTSRCV